MYQDSLGIERSAAEMVEGDSGQKYEAPEGGAATINVEEPFVGAYVNEKIMF